MSELGMMLNDVEGDCCIAAVGHCDQILHPDTPIADATVQAAFVAWCGGDSMLGCDPLRVLQHWVWNGFNGSRLRMFGRVNSSSELIDAVGKFGVAYASMNSFQGTTNHSLAIIAADATGVKYVSWGAVYSQAWQTHNAGVNQCWAISDTFSFSILYWAVKNNWKIQVSIIACLGFGAYAFFR
jgi:hypothetical protein